MSVRDVLGFVLIPFVLFIAAQTLRGFGFGGGAWGFSGVGDLGLCVALSLLIIGGTCLLFQLPPGELPQRAVLIIVACSVAVVALGLIFMLLGLEKMEVSETPLSSRSREFPLVPTIRIMIEFAAVLTVLFFVPRWAKRDRY